MGIIRKTLSVGTLGFINFRSKAELLDRAEDGLEKAESRNQQLSDDVERTVRKARKSQRRAQKAELQLFAAEKRIKLRGGRRTLEHLPADSAAALSDASRSAKRQAKKVGRRARKMTHTD